MNRHVFFCCLTAILALTADGLRGEQCTRNYKIMLTAPSSVGSPNPLFTEPCQWPRLRGMIDGYKYYGRQFMAPAERRLDPVRVAEFTKTSKLGVGIEFGHMFLPPEGSTEEPWQRWLDEAIAEIQPVFAADGRVDSVHIDGGIRRILGFGGGGGDKQRALTYDEALDQFVKFWVKLENQYKGIRIGYLVNFPNWDYTKEYHGVIGHFTDKTGKYFHDVLADLHDRLRMAGGTLAFVEVDCPYKYYVATKTHAGDASVDNPAKIRALERWCDARRIKLHMIVNEQALSQQVGDPAPELVERETKRFTENSVRFVQALADDGITPDVFLIQSWYGVPRIHVPESKPGTMTHTGLEIASRIEQCF